MMFIEAKNTLQGSQSPFENDRAPLDARRWL
jgi:hypothetical protein